MINQDLLKQFPIIENVTYLNHAAVAPWPKVTTEAVNQFAQENLEYGATHYPQWLNTEKQLRTKLKSLINASSTQEIALAKNTSEALSIIAYGINWTVGDEVLISNHEFPSNRIVWESLETKGVTVKTVNIDNTDDPTQTICDNITQRTKLVSISSVQYASGVRVDLQRIGIACRTQDTLFCVDAIQSLGAIPFDNQTIGADFIVADGHKWMLGPEGLALLYVRQSLIETLDLNQFGWHMVNARGNYDLTEWEPANDATRFECGSPNMLGIHALNASLNLILEIGVATIYENIQERIEFIHRKFTKVKDISILSPAAQEQRSGIITFKVNHLDKPQHSALHQTLMQNNIICAYRGGGIRFSPHFYTPITQLEAALDQVTSLI
ncbi:class V aminotransferase [Oleiphilus messinensis]|uniref:Class V aminotransferase n=1 Tax=Oleiphilus messinensis TaxID=141451 RepID=A0A1Y0IC07_9GAMM|nr:aminotransferase class V-fold PLP-dependent enzyme [Oleiphilus messinensis]ARU56934.1 class V aminotransferase [Oleiphilus messinensis]